jgi:hypothetical protein
MSVGYARTWVLKRFHITAAIALGCSIGVVDVDSYKSNGLDVYPSIFPRFAVGYNADTWSINARLYANILYTTFAKESKTSLATGNGRLTFIKRFNRPRK